MKGQGKKKEKQIGRKKTKELEETDRHKERKKGGKEGLVQELWKQ